MNTYSTSVLNTIAATGGDIALTAGVLTITGVPSMKYANITSIGRGFAMPLVEAATVKEVSYTAGNNTNYKFSIQQRVGDNVISHTADYTSDASGTDAEIAAALVLQINKWDDLKVTASGTVSPITLTADAGYPFFTVTNISNTTVTAAQPTKAPHATAATAIAGTTTVTVTTAAAHGLVTGNSVNISGVATMSLTYQGVASLSAVSNVRITYASSTTFTLDGVVGTGTNSGTIVITVVAQAARGVGVDLVAAGISGASTANNYAQIAFTYDLNGVAVPAKTGLGDNVHVMYVSANLAASPYTATTNFSTFQAELEERLSAYVPSTTNADPEAVSKQ